MKKLLVITLFILGISFSFAGTFYNGNYTSFENITLDNGTNQIGPTNQYYLKVWGEKEINDEPQYATPGLTPTDGKVESRPNSSSLQVTCKNGKIIEVKSVSTQDNSTIATLSGPVDQIIITYGHGNGADNIKGSFIATCKPITEPVKALVDNTNINYQNINANQQDPLKNNAITSIKPQIEPEDTSGLVAGQDPHFQPTFVDILFLQLDTISQLSQIAMLKNPNFNFADLFSTTEDFNNYQNWLNKFSAYPSKEAFVDAFSGAIGLKDIGIAQDVILGLYDCIQNSNCTHNIVFHAKDAKTNTYVGQFPASKFDIYQLKDIENKLYSGNENIINYSTGFAQSMLNSCNNIDNISDEFIKTQTQGICNLLTSNNVDSTGFDLGYGLTTRINNLNTLKQSFQGSGANLLGIFNVYRELNNLSVGTTKATIVSKITDSTNTGEQAQLLQKIDKIDLDQVLKNKFSSPDTKQDIIAIIQTREKIIKNELPKDDFKNVDLYKNSNYSINNGVVTEIDGKNITNNTNEVESNNSDIDSITAKDNWNKLDVKYANGSTQEFVLAPSVTSGDLTIYPSSIPIYIKTEDSQTFKQRLINCFYVEHTWWGDYTAFSEKCFREKLKEFDRIYLYYWWGYIYASYHQKEE